VLLLLIIGCVSLLLFVPSIQKEVSHQAADWLEKKIETPVSISGIYLDFPNGVSIEELYLEDQEQDTLLYTGNFKVAVDYFALLHSELEVSNILLEAATVNLKVASDSSFNFDYIIQAFNSKSEEKVETDTSSSSGLSFDIGTIKLKNVRFSYHSEPDGMSTQYNIGELVVEVETLDLDEGIYLAESINLSNTSGSFQFFKSVEKEEEPSTEPLKMLVGSKEVELNNVDFTFKNVPGKQDLITHVGYLNLDLEPIEFLKSEIIVNAIQLDSSRVNFAMKSELQESEAKVETEESGSDWKFTIQKFDLSAFQFKFDDQAEAPTNAGIDFSHLDLSVKQMQFSKLYFNGIGDLGFQLAQLEVSEKSDFVINEAQMDFKMDSSQITANEFIIKTNNSNINTSAQLQFDELAKISSNLGELKIKSDFNQSYFSLKDLAYFAPDFAKEEATKPYADLAFRLDGQINGQVNQLNFNRVVFSLKNSTTIRINGNLDGLPEIESINYNFIELIVRTTAKDLQNLLPKNTIPSTIHLPKQMKMAISSKGSMEKMAAVVDFKSSLGDLKTTISFEKLEDTNKLASYKLKTEIPSFDLGSLLQDTMLGNFAFSGTIKGVGLSLEEMDMNIDASIKDFEYANYQYSDLIINGKMQDEAFSGNFEMNDSNLVFDFSGKAKLDSIMPEFDFLFNLEGIDLQHLGIFEEDYRASGKLVANFTGINLENLNGKISLTELFIIHQENQYRLDSLVLTSDIDSGKTAISLQSDLLDANFNGNIYLPDLAESIQEHLKNRLSDSTIYSSQAAQNFNFSVDIKETELITDILLPDLNHLEAGKIAGEYDNQRDILYLEANFPSIDYDGIIIDSIRLFSQSDTNRKNISTGLTIRRVSFDTLSIENFKFQGDISQRKEAALTLQLLNDFNEPLFQLKGTLQKQAEHFRFHFTEQEQILNSNVWEVPSSNEIIFGDSIFTDQLSFSNNNQRIKIQTIKQHHEISFFDFELASLFTLIQKNQGNIGGAVSNYDEFRKSQSNGSKEAISDDTTSIIKGNLNGKVLIPLDTNEYLSANVNIDQLTYNDIDFGNLSANYTKLLNRDSVEVTLSGEENKLQVNGWLKKEEIKIDVAIEELKMSLVEAFSGGQIVNSQGKIKGDLELFGPTNNLEMKGVVAFNDIRFKSTFLGETYRLSKEQIEFSKNTIRFNNFTLQDSSGQKFITNGTIGIKQFDNPTFDLAVKIDHFQFLNSTKENSDFVYGSVFASADLKLKGNLNKPIANATLGLEKGTDITFFVPESEASEINREGIVEFVDKYEKIPALLRTNKEEDTMKVDIMGIEFTSVITINKEAKLTIIIDPITEDRLVVKGGGEVRLDIDPSGRINMNGIYEITEGDYEIRLYNLVKRQFNLKPGSKLVWNGEPLKAVMDIQGIYTAKTSPLGLLGNQISNLTEAERNQYKKRIPFNVILILGGEIMKPDIRFEIELPDDQKASVDGAILTKLNQLNQNESELNKQVFSFIVLKRFYSQDPFGSSGGGSYAARESVSQILNNQLNSLTDKYVKGVEVELNVDSYNEYSDGGDAQGATDLNLSLSKSLFDERVTVKIDGDLNVEDSDQTRSNAVAGDVSVEYKITEDGKYRFKIYRNEEYEGLIEGEFIETGASFIYNKEFLKFSDLFKARLKKEEADY
tara:strand:+ start:7034 stop:12019 length:4986 start_codon:yes stop_codon:yes gene_type:complete